MCITWTADQSWRWWFSSKDSKTVPCWDPQESGNQWWQWGWPAEPLKDPQHLRIQRTPCPEATSWPHSHVCWRWRGRPTNQEGNRKPTSPCRHPPTDTLVWPPTLHFSLFATNLYSASFLRENDGCLRETQSLKKHQALPQPTPTYRRGKCSHFFPSLSFSKC